MLKGLLRGQVNTDDLQATGAQGSSTDESCSPFCCNPSSPHELCSLTEASLPAEPLHPSKVAADAPIQQGSSLISAWFPIKKSLLSQGKGFVSSFTSIFSAQTYPLSCLKLPLLCTEDDPVFNLQQFGPPVQHLTSFRDKIFTQQFSL